MILDVKSFGFDKEWTGVWSVIIKTKAFWVIIHQILQSHRIPGNFL